MKERTIICNGVSKAYAMTGWRLGWVAAPEWIIKGMNKLQGQYTSGTNDVAQRAALAAYTGSQQCVEDMRVAFQRRRDFIVELAKEIMDLRSTYRKERSTCSRTARNSSVKAMASTR